jgi:hypothetical protein
VKTEEFRRLVTDNERLCLSTLPTKEIVMPKKRKTVKAIRVPEKVEPVVNGIDCRTWGSGVDGAFVLSDSRGRLFRVDPNTGTYRKLRGE